MQNQSTRTKSLNIPKLHIFQSNSVGGIQGWFWSIFDFLLILPPVLATTNLLASVAPGTQLPSLQFQSTETFHYNPSVVLRFP
jgi:hypothetical protein